MMTTFHVKTSLPEMHAQAQRGLSPHSMAGAWGPGRHPPPAGLAGARPRPGVCCSCCRGFTRWEVSGKSCGGARVVSVSWGIQAEIHSSLKPPTHKGDSAHRRKGRPAGWAQNFVRRAASASKKRLDREDWLHFRSRPTRASTRTSD